MAIVITLNRGACASSCVPRVIKGMGLRSMATIPTKLAINDVMKQLPAKWALVEGREAIVREFAFGDFGQAWSFMSKSAVLAEKMNHHPEWFNVFNRVDVTLATHDCGGISTNDLSMAKKMNEFAAAVESESAARS